MYIVYKDLNNHLNIFLGNIRSKNKRKMIIRVYLEIGIDQ